MKKMMDLEVIRYAKRLIMVDWQLVLSNGFDDEQVIIRFNRIAAHKYVNRQVPCFYLRMHGFQYHGNAVVVAEGIRKPEHFFRMFEFADLFRKCLHKRPCRIENMRTRKMSSQNQG